MKKAITHRTLSVRLSIEDMRRLEQAAAAARRSKQETASRYMLAGLLRDRVPCARAEGT
jgi:hypothetical protein